MTLIVRTDSTTWGSSFYWGFLFIALYMNGMACIAFMTIQVLTIAGARRVCGRNMLANFGRNYSSKIGCTHLIGIAPITCITTRVQIIPRIIRHMNLLSSIYNIVVRVRCPPFGGHLTRTLLFKKSVTTRLLHITYEYRYLCAHTDSADKTNSTLPT